MERNLKIEPPKKSLFSDRFDRLKVEFMVEQWNEQREVKKCRSTDKVIAELGKFITNNEITHVEITESSLNYNTVLADKNFFFDYRWSIQDFYRNKNYLKFLSDGSIWINYKSINEKSKPKLNAEKPVVTNAVHEIKGYDELMATFRVMKYDEYLLTEHWKHFIGEAVRWANYRCQLCNKDHTMLHVHHKTYDNKGRETFNDVIVLCKECHEMVHNKGQLT